MSLNIAQQFMKEIVKKIFWSIKNSSEILNKLKSRVSSIWFVYI